jgi:hypothetical protein
MAVFTSFLQLFYLLVTTIFFGTALIDGTWKSLARKQLSAIKFEMGYTYKPVILTSKDDSERQISDMEQY